MSAQLIPPDKKRCQAEKPNPEYRPFGIGAPPVPRRVRCENAPTVTIKEAKPDANGVQGSMTLCDDCLEVAKRQLGADYFTITARVTGKATTRRASGPVGKVRA